MPKVKYFLWLRAIIKTYELFKIKCDPCSDKDLPEIGHASMYHCKILLEIFLSEKHGIWTEKNQVHYPLNNLQRSSFIRNRKHSNRSAVDRAKHYGASFV